MLGDRSNLLPRRQEDLELPMSPIRNPSSLAFLDSKTEMDTHSRHVPHQLHKPLESHDKRHQATGFKLNNRIRPSNYVEYSNIILPPHTSRDVSQLSESLISFHNSPEQLSSTKHQKRIKEPAPQVILVLHLVPHGHNCGCNRGVMINVYLARCLRKIF